MFPFRDTPRSGVNPSSCIALEQYSNSFQTTIVCYVMQWSSAVYPPRVHVRASVEQPLPYLEMTGVGLSSEHEFMSAPCTKSNCATSRCPSITYTCNGVSYQSGHPNYVRDVDAWLLCVPQDHGTQPCIEKLTEMSFQTVNISSYYIVLEFGSMPKNVACRYQRNGLSRP